MVKVGWAACLLAVSAVPAYAQSRMPVAASFSILGDLVGQVGGDRVTVVTLVGPNGDVHEFEPSPQDVGKVSAARVLVLNGLGLEGWMARLAKMSPTDLRRQTIVASDGIPTRTFDAAGRDSEAGGSKLGAGLDPHAWQDPRRVEVYIRNIANGLAKADPPNAAYYAQRAAAYTQKLETLDAWVAQRIASVPEGKRKLITSHDAFGYFAARYGLQMVGLNGVNTSAEAGARDVADIVRVIRSQHIKALFIENISNPRLMQQVSNETGAAIGGELYSDSLSKADGPAPDYVSLIRYNVNTLVAGMLKN